MCYVGHSCSVALIFRLGPSAGSAESSAFLLPCVVSANSGKGVASGIDWYSDRGDGVLIMLCWYLLALSAGHVAELLPAARWQAAPGVFLLLRSSWFQHLGSFVEAHRSSHSAIACGPSLGLADVGREEHPREPSRGERESSCGWWPRPGGSWSEALNELPVVRYDLCRSRHYRQLAGRAADDGQEPMAVVDRRSGRAWRCWCVAICKKPLLVNEFSPESAEGKLDGSWACLCRVQRCQCIMTTWRPEGRQASNSIFGLYERYMFYLSRM